MTDRFYWLPDVHEPMQRYSRSDAGRYLNSHN